MSWLLLLYVAMCALAARPPSSSTTLRLTAQRNDTGAWTAKFGDYQMVIEHKHFDNEPLPEPQDGTWTLKVKYTSTGDDVIDEGEDRMDMSQRHNKSLTSLPAEQPIHPPHTSGFPLSDNEGNSPADNETSNLNYLPTSNGFAEFYRRSGNTEYFQNDTESNNEYKQNNEKLQQVDQSLSNNEDQQLSATFNNNENRTLEEALGNNGDKKSEETFNNNEQYASNNEDEELEDYAGNNEDKQIVQPSSNNQQEGSVGNETSVALEQMTSEEREHYLAEQERRLIMDRYPRSRSLSYDLRELELESKGYRYYAEVGWVKLNSAHWQWDQAKKSCEGDGGNLVVPDTLSKIKMFTRVLKENVDIIERAVLKNQVFVGVYVPYNSRRFVTVKGEPFVPESVSIWFPNEPNNADPGEDCVTLHLEGRLRDVPCFYNLPFLCQIH